LGKDALGIQWIGANAVIFAVGRGVRDVSVDAAGPAEYIVTTAGVCVAAPGHDPVIGRRGPTAVVFGEVLATRAAAASAVVA
jgi:hypothetical protein